MYQQKHVSVFFCKQVRVLKTIMYVNEVVLGSSKR